MRGSTCRRAWQRRGGRGWGRSRGGGGARGGGGGRGGGGPGPPPGGGTDLIQRTTGLTYAEYARRGFFELVAASALVLPILLAADWAVRNEAPQQRRTFRSLAGLLILLLAVVMASALERMRLYVDQFGLSEVRLYATAFMEIGRA